MGRNSLSEEETSESTQEGCSADHGFEMEVGDEEETKLGRCRYKHTKEKHQNDNPAKLN